jgi:hypothetical protein
VSARAGRSRPGRVGQRGQSTLEMVIAVIPLLLLLTFGIIAVGRVTMGKMAVTATAREAARAAAQVDRGSAPVVGAARGEQVAAGYGLINGSLILTIDAAGHRAGGDVWATATYTIRFDDLPLLGMASVTVSNRGHERIDVYR